MPIGNASADRRAIAGAGGSSLRGLATIMFLGLVAGMQMSDRGLQSVLLPAIKRAFAVDDATLGALQGMAGILVGSALAVPLARLADRFSRKWILVGVIVAWGALTALAALAPNFPLYFIGRSASGVTEFAMIPIVYSLIPDLVAERWRLAANLSFAALMALGASCGFYFGGDLLGFAARTLMPGELDAWRRAMLLLSLTAVPLSTIGLFVRDPPRRHMQDHVSAPVSLAAFVLDNGRALLALVGAAGGLAVGVQALTAMIAMALDRRFSVGLDRIGHVLGIVTLATSLGCLPIAGLLDRLLAGRLGQRTRPVIIVAMALTSLPVAIALGMAGGAGIAFGLLAGFLFLTCTANAFLPTIVQEMVPAALRARGLAVYSFVIAAFCAAGPLLAGLLSDHLFAGDLLAAIAAAAAPPLLLTAICAALLARAMKGPSLPAI